MTALHPDKGRKHPGTHHMRCMHMPAGQFRSTQYPATLLDRHHTTSTKYIVLRITGAPRALTRNGASTSMRRSNVGNATSMGMRLTCTLPVPACSHTCAAHPRMAFDPSVVTVLWAVVLRRRKACKRKHYLADPMT